MFIVDADPPGISHVRLGQDGPDKRYKQQEYASPTQPLVFEPGNRHDVLISAWDERANNDNRDNDCKEQLKDSTDEIMGAYPSP